MQDNEYPFRQEWHGGNLQYFPTPQGHDIYARLLPEWAERFATGQEKYKDVEHLGAKGVFPDVNRKTGRLRSDIWHERTPPQDAEPTRVVMLDLIGHLFLMLHLWDQDEVSDGECGEDAEPTTKVSLHTGARSILEQVTGMAYPKTPVVWHSTLAKGNYVQGHEESGCPDPVAHDDGWEALPAEAREVLRRIAAGDRVEDKDRNAVIGLVEKHEG